MSGSALHSLIETQFAQLVQHVRMQLVLTHDDCNELITFLSGSESPFSSVHVEQMGRVTDELLTRSVATSSAQGASQCQEHAFIHKYLGASTWELLQGEMSISHKIETLCRLMVSRCFLRNPNEATRRDMVALVYKASSTDTINAAETLKHVQRARTIYKTLRQMSPGPKGPKTYPSDPALFQSMFPSSTIMTDDPPAPSPIADDELHIAQKLVPMRKTHGSVRTHAQAIDVDRVSHDRVQASHDRVRAPHASVSELANFILGSSLTERLTSMSAAPHSLHAPKPAKAESPGTKSEPHASTPMKTEPKSSPPKLNADALDMDMDASDLFDMDAGASSTTLDHATSKQASPTDAPSLHGDLNELRHMADSRFKGFEKPHPSRHHASDSAASAATKNPPGRSLRLRTKSPPDSWIPPSTTMSMKRPAASSTMSATHDASSEWKVHQYERKDGSGKHYYTYESPDGSRYPSLKKARVNGYVS